VRRLPLPVAVIVAAAALVALLVYGVVSRQQDTTIEDALKKGRRVSAPSRELPVLGSGERRSPADLRGRVVVLNFWASWCTPCKVEAPALEGAHRRYAGDGLTVLGVNFRDTIPDARGFARRYGLTYSSVRDVDGRLAHDYGTVALPETFVLDRRGRIAAAFRGTVTRRELESTVPPLLAEGA
jgi:cytochrome c biogenesis protein CcmG, thiol:disulfide interchange protein DsbE